MTEEIRKNPKKDPNGQTSVGGLPETKPKRPKKKNERGKLKLLVGIVDQSDANKVSEILSRDNPALSYAFKAEGTARTTVLEYFGLGATEKRMILSLIPETAERQILDGIRDEMALYLVGKGICFTLPLTGVSSIVANGILKGTTVKETADGRKTMKEKKERTYDLIVVAVQSGFSTDAMNAARTAGAAGGTLIRAFTLDNRKAEQVIGVTFQQETEILFILARTEGKTAIMRAIQETAGLKTDAGGVLFSLPVDDLVGVGGR